MHRLAPVLVVVVAALLISGCGSDNKQTNKYVDAVNKAQTDFASTFDRLSSRITATSTPEQDQQTLDGFKAAVDKVVGDLRAVEVPSKVKGLHGQLVAEISAYGAEINKAKRAFADGDPQTIEKAQTALVSAVTRVSSQINGTIDAINKKLRE
jgi:outer membrane murein-binding lipoprotein Lpp